MQSHLLRIVRNLNLSGNQIREVLFRKHFGNSNLLRNLDLSHNNLSAIEDCAFCNTSLDELNLGYNGLRSVNPDMVHHVSISKIYHIGVKYDSMKDLAGLRVMSQAPEWSRVRLEPWHVRWNY